MPPSRQQAPASDRIFQITAGRAVVRDAGEDQGAHPVLPVSLPAVGSGCPGLSVLPPSQRDRGQGEKLLGTPGPCHASTEGLAPRTPVSAPGLGSGAVILQDPLLSQLHPLLLRRGVSCGAGWTPSHVWCLTSGFRCLSPGQILGVPRSEFSILGVCSLRGAQATEAWAPGARGAQSRLLGPGVCRAPQCVVAGLTPSALSTGLLS